MRRRDPKKTETLELRLPPETKRAFMAACRSNGASASQVLRAAIERYLVTASRAPTVWKRELDMTLAAKSPGARLAAGLAGLAAAAVAAVSLVAPARAATDPRIAAVFDLFDRDHDGRVTAAEFLAPPADTPGPAGVELEVETRAPPRPGDTPEILFGRLDANGDGVLLVGELAAAAVARAVPTPALVEADRDRDGLIGEGELAAHLAVRRAAAGMPDPAAGVGPLASAIIAEHDRDGDGRIRLADLGS